MTKPRVSLLIADPDEELAGCLQEYLEKKFDGRLHVAIHSRQDSLCDEAGDHDMLLFSSDMPDADPCRRIRQIRVLHHQLIIVYMLRAYSSRQMEDAFSAGADDVVCRYGASDECRLRICHWISRAEQEKNGPYWWYIGDRSFFDAELQILTVCGETYRLPRMEARILEKLCRRIGRLVPHADLMACYGTGWEINSNSKDRSISRLRKYLKADDSVSIDSVRPTGYVLRIAANQK